MLASVTVMVSGMFNIPGVESTHGRARRLTDAQLDYARSMMVMELQRKIGALMEGKVRPSIGFINDGDVNQQYAQRGLPL
jgi:hypothetical protein